MTEPRLQKITDLDRGEPNCPICKGEGWVCENHREIAWDEGDGCCGGAGAPCKCNLLSEVK